MLQRTPGMTAAGGSQVPATGNVRHLFNGMHGDVKIASHRTSQTFTP